MSMVFCRGCGQSIHFTATACPKCGAQQSLAAPSKGWGSPMAWVIASAPLIGAFAEGVVEGLSGYGGSLLFLVTLAINIFLCTLDEKALRKEGVDTAQLGAVFIVPVYLFKRAKLLNEKPVYATLWCLLFLLQLLSV